LKVSKDKLTPKRQKSIKTFFFGGRGYPKEILERESRRKTFVRKNEVRIAKISQKGMNEEGTKWKGGYLSRYRKLGRLLCEKNMTYNLLY